MKKIFGTLPMVLLLAGAVGAQGIIVTSPDGGEIWKTGSDHPITWSSNGLSGNVKIGLFKGDTHLGNIVEHQFYQTGYTWHVGDPLLNGKTYGAGSDYKIQVQSEVNWQWKDLSDNPFTIKTGMAAGLPEGGAAINPIHITAPTKESVWTIGETHTIRWEAADKVKYPLWLFLVTADKKIPVVDIGKTSGFLRPMSMNWTVTDNLFTEEFRIRITSADNEYETHSMPFRIMATKITAFDVLPASVANKVGWHRRHSYEDSWIAVGEPFKSGDVLTSVPNPGGLIIKYGYQRWYQDSDNHERLLHRSIVSFNLGAVISKLKHKATVKSAYIDWKKAGNSPQACAPNIFCLDAHMPNVDSLFGQAFVSFPKHLLTGEQSIQIQMAQRWLDDPSKNYGLVVAAVNEGQSNENGQCVQFCDNVVMKLEIEEKLNK
jgi:hypothetical protein